MTGNRTLIRCRLRSAAAALLAVFVATALLILASGPLPASAGATFTVNSTTDATDASPGNGVCETAPGNGVCTLRAAIQEANALAGADTINVPAGTYTLTIPGANEDLAATGDLDIRDSLTINGAGAASTIVDGNSGVTGDRVFDVISGTDGISGFTIRMGNLVDGGGIRIDVGSTVTLTNSTVTQNGGTDGGGIANFGTLTLNGTTVNSNSASGSGGGVYSSGGSLTLNSTSVIDNSSHGAATGSDGGGGIWSSGGSLTLNSSTVSGNSSSFYGGGIKQSGGPSSLSHSTVSSNRAGADGGGIDNSGGTLTVTNSTVSGNSQSGSSGGGINNEGAAGSTLVLLSSTVNGNTAGSCCGGGIINSGTATVTDSTISGNTGGSFGGGGIFNNAGTLTASSSTISGNSGGFGSGGGIYSNTGVTLKDSIVANSTSGGNCVGTITSGGHNLSSDATCPFTATGDLNSTDPILGPLANNGGPTQTQALLAGSPAIDAGNPAGCTDNNSTPLTTDQRSAARSIDGNLDGTAVCDMGAYEYGDTDADGVPDASDNCPNWYNPSQALPVWPIASSDPDCDGFSASVETFVGTDPASHCGTNAWPPDFNSDAFVNLTDVLLMRPHFASTLGNANYSARFDLNADNSINLTDVLKMRPFFSHFCS